VKKKHFFTFSHFPSDNLLKPSNFFTLRFYFTMVLGHYSSLSFIFFNL
jgi:hypothetical protein